MSHFIQGGLMTIGGFTTLIVILGALNIGHLRIYYGPDEHGCTKMESRINKEPA